MQGAGKAGLRFACNERSSVRQVRAVDGWWVKWYNGVRHARFVQAQLVYVRLSSLTGSAERNVARVRLESLTYR
jgi:hypothetical protein